MILDFIIIAVIIGISLFLLEWATIYFHIPKPLSRKIAHTGISVLIIGLSILFGWQLFVYVGALFFFFLLALRLFYPLKSLSDRSVESIGEIVYPLGIMVSALVCQTQMDFVVTILILGISDTVAFYIGSNFKSKVLIFNKTLLGSAGFFFSTFAILLLAASPFSAVFLALGLTSVELFSPKGLDNLSVPAVVALLLTLVS